MKRWRRSRSDGAFVEPADEAPRHVSSTRSSRGLPPRPPAPAPAGSTSSRSLSHDKTPPPRDTPAPLPIKLLGKSVIFKKGSSRSSSRSRRRGADLVRGIQATLPMTLADHNWRLLYSVQEHGANFGTFYAKVRNDAATLLVVETAQGEIFGGFASRTWRPSGSEYYGTGESYLFALDEDFQEDEDAERLRELFGGGGRVKIPVARPLEALQTTSSTSRTTSRRASSSSPSPRVPSSRHASARGSVVDVVCADTDARARSFLGAASSSGSSGEPGAASCRVHKYPWSGANSYFMVGTDCSIAMGGGGDWGLLLDDHFARGATGRSDTYANHPLGASPEFDVVNVECWGFTTSASLREDAAKYHRPPVAAMARSQ